MATAMLSSFTSRPIRGRVAMTGEITLRGNVLPVGGIKEKVLAARRSGIRTLLLPAANRKNLEEIPRSLRRDLKFIWVSHVSDVFRAALADPERPGSGAPVNRDIASKEPLLTT
jgi:ATP-dependent Lon protease